MLSIFLRDLRIKKMQKILKLQIIKENAECTEFKIAVQTERRRVGGGSLILYKYTDSENNILYIKSCNVPAMLEDTFFVRGTSYDRDHSVVTVLTPIWEIIKKAVLAYNQEYSNNKNLEMEDVIKETV